MENIHLKPVSGRKTVNISSQKRDLMKTHGKYKFRHEARIEFLNKKKKVQLIERQNKTPRGTYSELWRLFKEAGLPVVPSVRTVENENTVMMTDLTADGSELYGKELLLRLSRNSEFEPVFRSNMATIDSFLKIMEGEEFEKLKDKLEVYKHLANSNNIIFPRDDPFELVVHPSGEWSLIILDLYLGGKKLDRENTEQANASSVKGFISQLLEIKSHAMNL